jgi:hypothetical protein
VLSVAVPAQKFSRHSLCCFPPFLEFPAGSSDSFIAVVVSATNKNSIRPNTKSKAKAKANKKQNKRLACHLFGFKQASSLPFVVVGAKLNCQ